MNSQGIGTHEKALQINLDRGFFGTFAEIGAGQEVVRWFFQAGGAAGSVAKTMSAYDMEVSDAIYGTCQRYVSRERLQGMLDYEWMRLMQRLDKSRGERTKFFVFADTVAARSFTRQEPGDGWLGVRFQTEPRAEPSEIIIHARVWDQDNPRQQEALGVLGVNLMHAAFYRYKEPTALIGALLDDLQRERVEVDMIKFSGPVFSEVDHRLMSLQLVDQRLTNAAFFTADGDVVEPAEVLYKKPVLIERGSFRPMTNVMLDMLDRAEAQMRRDPAIAEQQPVVLLEMTLRNLAGAQPGVDHADFLARADTLSVFGKTVMISNYSRFHNVSGYLRRYTQNPVVMAMGVPTLTGLFAEEHYADLEGGILEAFGRLFQGAVKLYVYPRRNLSIGGLLDVNNFQPPPSLRHLYAYLLQNRFIQPIKEYRFAELDVLPKDVLQIIQDGDPIWETLVPLPVVERIKRDRLFGYAGATNDTP